jgi:N-acetylglutamate synthase-like GNAT family acetyltransferase
VLVREARPEDADGIAPLLAQLGYPAEADVVRARLASLGARGDRTLVAEHGGKLVGVLTLHRTPVLHRPADVGRITALVVDGRVRGGGVGRALVAAAERILRDAGCERVEVTSAARREDAHAFYRRLGYDAAGVRFGKPLDG